MPRQRDRVELAGNFRCEGTRRGHGHARSRNLRRNLRSTGPIGPCWCLRRCAKSTCKVCQRWRNRPRHSRNRPVESVGLPRQSQMISVRSSVSAPSATSHTRSLMDEASSNTSRIRFPSLCRPANASVLVSDHGTMSHRQVRSCFASRLVIEVAPKLNQVLCNARRYHFASSGHVLVRNCTSVFAVITALQSG